MGHPEEKLPVRQLVILAICRVAEPIALTSVYPFIPEMIESFGIPTDKVAKWAGLASACFSLCQCLTAILWGRMSDHFGRKYLVLISLAGTMITSIAFGLSRSLPAMLIARSIAGAGSGTVGIIRTMVAEMVPQKSLQPRAFSVMPLVWTIGSVLGPSFGGALSNPARQYPSVFGQSWFFHRYPYSLPSLVASAFFLVGLTVGTLFLHETLASKKDRKDYGLILGNLLSSPCRKRRPRSKSWQSADESEPFLAGHESGSNSKPEPQKRAGVWDVMTGESNKNLLAYTLLAAHSQGYDQLLPVFMHHPPQDINDPQVTLPLKFAGGFGLTSGRIGVLFTVYGIAGMCIQFLVFPPIAKKFGVLRCFRLVAVCFPGIYLLTPFTSLIPSKEGKQGAMLVLMLLKCFCGIFAFPCSTILLTNSASSLNILGTLNGVATSTSAIGRAIGPFLGGTIFTIGVDAGYVIAPWWVMALIAVSAAIPVFYLKEMPGFAANDDASDDEDSSSIEIEAEDETPALPHLIQRDGRKPSTTTATDEEAIGDDFGPSLARLSSSGARPGRKFSALERRMSNPIGMGDIGPRVARRFSNNLGPTRSGMGAGSDFGTTS